MGVGPAAMRYCLMYGFASAMGPVTIANAPGARRARRGCHFSRGSAGWRRMYPTGSAANPNGSARTGHVARPARAQAHGLEPVALALPPADVELPGRNRPQGLVAAVDAHKSRQHQSRVVDRRALRGVGGRAEAGHMLVSALLRQHRNHGMVDLDGEVVRTGIRVVDVAGVVDGQELDWHVARLPGAEARLLLVILRQEAVENRGRVGEVEVGRADREDVEDRRLS